MRKSLLGLMLILAMAAAATPALAEGNANFVLGLRWLDEDDWEPVEEQGVFGVTVDFGKNDWPVNLAAGLMISGKEEDVGALDLTGTISELSFGVLKTWEKGSDGKTRPFFGGGLSFLSAEIEIDGPGGSVSEDDNSGAIYAQGGVYWRIGSRFNIGGDVRVLFGSDLEALGIEGDADYFQLGLLLGWGWPAE